MADDEIMPDYHGPKAYGQDGFGPHKRAHETATDLVNGRVTNSEARRVLRESLDIADKKAPKAVPKIG